MVCGMMVSVWINNIDTYSSAHYSRFSEQKFHFYLLTFQYFFRSYRNSWRKIEQNIVNNTNKKKKPELLVKAIERTNFRVKDLALLAKALDNFGSKRARRPMQLWTEFAITSSFRRNSSSSWWRCCCCWSSSWFFANSVWGKHTVLASLKTTLQEQFN